MGTEEGLRGAGPSAYDYSEQVTEIAGSVRRVLRNTGVRARAGGPGGPALFLFL